MLTSALLPGPATGSAVGAAQTAPWVLALLCVTLGRWAPARALVLVGLVARTGVAVAAQFHPTAAFTQHMDLLGLWAVLGVLVLVAPPDAVDVSTRGRSWAMACALAIALPMSGIAVLWLGTWPADYGNIVFTPYQQALLDASTAWPVFVLSFAFLQHLGRPDTDGLRAGGIALAVLPWTVMVAPPLYRSAPADAHDLLRNGGVVLAFLALATAVGVLLRNSRRIRLAAPAGPGASGPTA
ncbi:hypothetical protein [Kitasatospora kazusensis]|uniref:hypothetical protein n=1 Tax=Kitasatospora kazusensis TaxID=407974 RepID=UPI0031D4DA61